ncbi:MAG: hypothetical protein J1E00_06655 [Oscillospiraceae bacterium]|nr:hypothetical protein [Oscillospiraceae bacterium]
MKFARAWAWCLVLAATLSVFAGCGAKKSMKIPAEETVIDDGDLSHVFTCSVEGNVVTIMHEGVFDGIFKKVITCNDDGSASLDYCGSNGKVLLHYDYDTNGRKTKETSYLNESIRYSIYEYDANGNNTKITNYDADDNLVSYAEYAYDNKGNKIRFISYDRNGKTIIHREYEYDENGNMTKDIDCRVSAATREYNYAYRYEHDGKGNTTKTIYSDGNVKSIHEYNEKGHETKATFYSTDGALWRVREITEYATVEFTEAQVEIIWQCFEEWVQSYG